MKPLSIELTDDARSDAKHYMSFLANDRTGLDVQFAEAAEATMDKLAEMPGLGSPYESDIPQLLTLRVYPVTGFPNHLILYREWGTVLKVVAVLHASLNLDRVLSRRLEL
ncbi:MAG TPA: type II toxin-antitoxin system RelE/ParE family toxin [Fimbriiglobus sp.]|jgi:plasmid stabilization system protein ParE